MSRVINPESAGKERLQLLRGAALALRELATQNAPGPQARDLAAFIALSLEAVEATVEVTVAAWEKRDYWLKADRFRMEWRWAGQQAAVMRRAVLEDDWAAAAQSAAAIAGKLQGVKIPVRHKLGTPWVGAYQKLAGKP